MSYRIASSMRLLVLPLLLAASRLCAQPSTSEAKLSTQAAAYLAEVQRLVQQHALYADSLDWPQLSREVAEQARGLATTEDCQAVVDHLLRTLRQAGDQHSFIIPAAKIANWTAAGPQGPPAESRYLGDGTGYLKVPGLASFNPAVGQAFSQDVQRQIAALEAQHELTGWVLDLRQNTGGNMYPMIAGLQPLLGEGVYGYFLFPRRTLMKAMPKYAWSGKAKEKKASKAAKTPPKVAVLIDSLTASSGEMVAMAFKGRSQAKLFGQPSAGRTTTNQDFRLSDGSLLLLATGYMADRNRNKHVPHIAPDVVVEYSAVGAPDKTIEAAKKWLLEAK